MHRAENTSVASAEAAREIRGHLEQLIASEMLTQSGRLQSFLRFIVESALEGRAGELKESVIGVQVFERDPGYDPKIDAIVRVEARRLRTKLLEYYAGPGAGATLRIDLPKGGYAPVFTTVQAIPQPPEKSRWARNRWATWGAIAAGAALAVLGAAQLRARFWNAPPMTTRQFTFLDGYSSDPSFSPDGKTVAFAWDPMGKKQAIYLQGVGLQAGRESPRALTGSTTAAEYAPAWSPDGAKIAFLRLNPGGGHKLIVFEIAAAAERALGTVSEDSPPSWSRDSKWIAMSDRETASAAPRVMLIDVATGGKRPLSSPPAGTLGDIGPALSPDGSRVVFRRRAEGAIDDLWWQPMQPANAPAVRLTFENHQVLGAAWLPDSKAIVASVQRGTQRSLSRISIPGGAMEAVGVTSSRPSSPAVASTGGTLAFVTRYFDSNLYTLVVDGGGPAEFAKSTALESGPAYSPDGQHVAFRSGRSGASEIWIASAAGENARRLTDAGGPVTGSPRWSPDGKYVAYDSRPQARAQIFVAAAAGGKPQSITSAAANCTIPWWSRDGRTLYFTSDRSGREQVWRIAMQSGHAAGEPEQVTLAGGVAGRESPDGKMLYYASRDRGGLWRMPLPAGAEEAVLPELAREMWGNWDFGNGRIFFIAPKPPGPAAELRFFDLTARAVQTLYTMNRYPLSGDGGLAVAPDGRSLLFGQVDRLGSDISVVENFR